MHCFSFLNSVFLVKFHYNFEHCPKYEFHIKECFNIKKWGIVNPLLFLMQSPSLRTSLIRVDVKLFTEYIHVSQIYV